MWSLSHCYFTDLWPVSCYPCSWSRRQVPWEKDLIYFFFHSGNARPWESAWHMGGSVSVPWAVEHSDFSRDANESRFAVCICVQLSCSLQGCCTHVFCFQARTQLDMKLKGCKEQVQLRTMWCTAFRGKEGLLSTCQSLPFESKHK